MENGTTQKQPDKILFVVECLRWNDRENHSYLAGVYDDELLALKAAWQAIDCRGGKYGAEISGYILNTFDQVYSRELDCWEAFANSCKETADRVLEMIKEEEMIESISSQESQ